MDIQNIEISKCGDSSYDEFIEKFKTKKTTDDCYTPKKVMDIVIDYVNDKYSLKDKNIVRPFYPGGDFKMVDYKENDVVIDNPPFSIISKICKWYIKKGIKFFLFCPHLTAFSSNIDATYIIASASITYENGAIVKTSFISNLFGDLKIIGDPVFYERFKKLNTKNKRTLPKYKYPSNIITVSKISSIVEKGGAILIHKKELYHYSMMDKQREQGKAIFGGGFLASNKISDEIKEKEFDIKNGEGIIQWDLSSRELQIIESLGEHK